MPVLPGRLGEQLARALIAALLEAERGAQRMLLGIPLTDTERAAVEGDQDAACSSNSDIGSLGVVELTGGARAPRTRGVRLVRCQAGAGGLVAGISSPSTRSVGSTTNTTHIMSGCCWLPLMKPITRRPVACSITESKRSRMTSWNSIR